MSRIFVGNFLRTTTIAAGSKWNSDVMDNIYLLTTDADVWPISRNIYDLPANVDVLSVNAFCCGMFKHRRKTYRMLPMSNIGARIGTWRDITYRYFSLYIFVHIRLIHPVSCLRHRPSYIHTC